jgi:hypothetical protein
VIDTIQYSTAICDNCGRRFSWLDAPSPQEVTQHLVDRYGWTAFDDIHHCGTCPPICPSCGLDDIDCECISGSTDKAISQSGDAPYVSREPNVIVGAFGCSGGVNNGQG